MWPLTVLMKQTRQAVRAIKLSIYLDVYESPAVNVFEASKLILILFIAMATGVNVIKLFLTLKLR